MDVHRYRRLNVVLSFSLFAGCLTNRCSGHETGGLAAFAGLLVFSSLILFLVSSSSAIYETISASFSGHAGVLFAPGLCRVARPSLAVYVASDVLLLAFRFQLPPPAL